MKKILKLFASCIPVKGAKRQIICDLQKNNIYFISEGLYEILAQHKDKEIEDIKSTYNNKYDTIIDNYTNYLLENELAFFCSDPEIFPDLEVKWDYPGRISNAIIEVDEPSKHNYKEIFLQIEELGCKFIELRFYNRIHLDKIAEIINYTNESIFRNIDILLQFDSSLSTDRIELVFSKYSRIGKIIVCNAPKIDTINLKTLDILYTIQNIKNNNHCGQVAPSYFTSNIVMYMESKSYNSCLNRKIAIDINGEIKNCPSISKTYGNIKNIALREALEKQGFKDYWFINKDQIEVCRDCEFRYICTDCRAFIEEPNNIFSKPLKCGYNPYTTEWEEWSTNPLKQKVINHYDLNDLNITE